MLLYLALLVAVSATELSTQESVSLELQSVPQPIFQAGWDSLKKQFVTVPSMAVDIRNPSRLANSAGPDKRGDGVQVPFRSDIVFRGAGISLGSRWTIDVWIRTPVANTRRWHTLVRGLRDHHILVHYRGAYIGSWKNTGWRRGFQNSGFRINLLRPGWHRMTVVNDVNKVLFYFDGSLKGQHAYGTSEPIKYLGNCCGGSQPFGEWARFKVYNTALRESQIQELFRKDSAEQKRYERAKKAAEDALAATTAAVKKAADLARKNADDAVKQTEDTQGMVDDVVDHQRNVALEKNEAENELRATMMAAERAKYAAAQAGYARETAAKLVSQEESLRKEAKADQKFVMDTEANVRRNSEVADMNEAAEIDKSLKEEKNNHIKVLENEEREHKKRVALEQSRLAQTLDAKAARDAGVSERRARDLDVHTRRSSKMLLDHVNEFTKQDRETREFLKDQEALLRKQLEVERKEFAERQEKLANQDENRLGRIEVDNTERQLKNTQFLRDREVADAKAEAARVLRQSNQDLQNHRRDAQQKKDFEQELKDIDARRKVTLQNRQAEIAQNIAKEEELAKKVEDKLKDAQELHKKTWETAEQTRVQYRTQESQVADINLRRHIDELKGLSKCAKSKATPGCGGTEESSEEAPLPPPPRPKIKENCC